MIRGKNKGNIQKDDKSSQDYTIYCINDLTLFFRFFHIQINNIITLFLDQIYKERKLQQKLQGFCYFLAVFQFVEVDKFFRSLFRAQLSAQIWRKLLLFLTNLRRRMSRRRRQEDIQHSSEEAEQAHQQIEEQDDLPLEEQPEGEDLMEDAERDDIAIPELDRYEDQGADGEEISQDLSARRRAERQMDKRRRRIGEDEMEDLLDDEDELQMQQLHRRRLIYADDDDEQIDERFYNDIEQVRGKLPEWIKKDQTIKYIKQKFSKFLAQYKPSKQSEHSEDLIYQQKLRSMCRTNKQSIQIDYEHLKDALPTIAIWVGLEPELTLPQLNRTAYYLACKNYPSYKNMFPQVFVKITKLPICDKIRDLRHSHLKKLIRIKGVITIRSEVLNQLKKVIFKCRKCGYLKGPFFYNVDNKISLGSCESCQTSGQMDIEKYKSVYRNYQKITVQESPSDVLPGRIPRQKEVVLLGDNIDIAKPGDQVEIIGIYKHRYECALNVKQGFPLFATLIQANHIVKLEGKDMQYDPTREKDYKKLANDPRCQQRIFNSIAPSIYGHKGVKAALTIAMFGGQAKVVQNHKVRGDINVLLLGDPGIAKSQFLKSVQKCFYRSIYTTGKGASAVGLTACVKKDYTTGQWKLEAGALVLADKGICLIDEFDKMNEHDRTSIHEAMQQQSISISKAGIVTSLRARCSVIAAANPIQGRYNSQLSFKQNVDLSDPILSRFDILCVIKDEANEQIDHDLSTFVINSHISNHPYLQEYIMETPKLQEKAEHRDLINHEFLRNYIRHARETCHPQFTNNNQEKILQFYSNLRKESLNTGGITVTARHLQSMVRCSVAHAKMRLRTEVQEDDVNFGIKLMLESFIQTQKNSVAKNLRSKYRSYLY